MQTFATAQGDHHLFRKTYAWEISAHVPAFLVWPPGVRAAAARGSSSERLGELRDVFATVLDIAGARAAARRTNGSSWACLAREDPTGATCGSQGGPWRVLLDMEHSTIFNATNHWSSVVRRSSVGVSTMAYPSVHGVLGVRYR